MTTSSDLGAALEAFIRENEYCGELDAALEENYVWMTCSCGRCSIGRWSRFETVCQPLTSNRGAPRRGQVWIS